MPNQRLDLMLLGVTVRHRNVFAASATVFGQTHLALRLRLGPNQLNSCTPSKDLVSHKSCLAPALFGLGIRKEGN